MNERSRELAAILERGAAELVEFAAGLSAAEWRSRLPKDGRKVGVIVHHVASMYPLEIELARKLAAGGALTDVTWAGVHEINARHAQENDGVTIAETLALLRRNAEAAAVAVRGLGDAELDRVAPNSLYGGAPLTCQFMLEDHAVRHSFHHLARLRSALGRAEPSASAA